MRKNGLFIHILWSRSCRRWEAAQVPGVREGLQPELQPHHAQQETHGLQTVRLWPLRERLPEESGPAEAQGDAARTQMSWSRCLSVKSCTFFFAPLNLCTVHMDAGVLFVFSYLLHWPLIVSLNVVRYLASDFLVDFMIIKVYLWSVFLHDY